MLPPGALAIARQAAEQGLTGRCDVLSATDTAGVQTWPASASNVPCQVGMPRQGGAMAMLDRLGNEPGAIIWVPVATAVKAGDRITVTGDATYEVAHAPAQRTQELLWGLVCIEIRSPGTVA